MTAPGSIINLFAQGVAQQKTIVWLEEHGDADGIWFDKRSTRLEKLAVVLPVPNDEKERQAYLEARLMPFVRQAEDAYALEALQEESVGKFTVRKWFRKKRAWAKAAHLGKEVCTKGSYLDPDAVLFHPDDRDLVFLPGLARVETTLLPRGTMVIGAFKTGASVWRLHDGVETEFSNEHADYFIQDISAFRRTDQLALTVYRPLAFQVVRIVSGWRFWL